MLIEDIDIPALFKSLAEGAIAAYGWRSADPVGMFRAWADVASIDNDTAEEIERRLIAHWRTVGSNYPWPLPRAMSISQLRAQHLSAALDFRGGQTDEQVKLAMQAVKRG